MKLQLPIGPSVQGESVPGESGLMLMVGKRAQFTTSYTLVTKLVGLFTPINTPTDAKAKLLIDDKRKGKWHHIAIVYSALQKNVKFYIDGELNQEGKYTQAGPAILGPARIGSWNGGGRDYEGEMDEFAIFNTRANYYQIFGH